MFAHKRNWMRHTAMVPKGFIRYHVLEALKEKPMSGSELIDHIEKHTGGHWKPSPGSMYPLLSLLQDHGYINELPAENGMKRYELTESGKALYEEQKRFRRRFREKAGFPPATFFDGFFTKIPADKACEVRDTIKRMGIAFFHLGATLQETYSEQHVNEAIGAVNEAASKLEEINKKLKGEQNE